MTILQKLNSKRGRLLFLVGAIMIVGMAIVTVIYIETIQPHKQKTITYSTDRPDETKPGKDYKWSGLPEDPKYIRLPSIRSSGYIQNVGIDQRKEIAVPANIHIAGWFVNSARPGQKGLSIIDGHVDGWTSEGIFIRLGELQPNDKYTVEMGNGEILHYRVVQVDSVDTAQAATTLFSQNPSIKSQLNLITCGGKFNKKTRQYEKRIIVASQLET